MSTRITVLVGLVVFWYWSATALFVPPRIWAADETTSFPTGLSAPVIYLFGLLVSAIRHRAPTT